MIRRYYYDGVRSSGLSGEELENLLKKLKQLDEALTDWIDPDEEEIIMPD